MERNFNNYWKSTQRITNPSLIVDSNYIPLFSGSTEAWSGNWVYGLDNNVTIDGSLHPATYRNYRNTYTGTISCSITHNEKEAYTATRPATREETQSETLGPWAANTDTFGYMYVNAVRVNFGRTYSSPPSVSLSNSASFTVSNVTTTGCDLRVHPAEITAVAYWISVGQNEGLVAILTLAQKTTTIQVSGKVTTSYTESYTAYRDKVKYVENYAYGSFNFGVTYSGTPSITSNNGVEITGISSTGVSFRKKLGGNVSTGKTSNLSFNFSISTNGNA